MPNIKICSECGRKVSADGIYCPFCGNEINKNSVSEKNETTVENKEREEKQQKNSEYQELKDKIKKLKKKQEVLELKISNYDRLSRNEIPNCIQNKDAPDIAVKNKITETTDVKWTVAAIAALIECISAFIPWLSIYYGDFVQGESISCAGFFGLLSRLSGENDWIEYQREWLSPLVIIGLLGFGMFGLNVYFLWKVLKKEKDIESLGICAGGSGILVAIALFLYKLFIKTSMEDEYIEWIAAHTELGLWLMLIGGIVLAGIMVCHESENKDRNEEIDLKLEVMNYDPVLPIRMENLIITSENNGNLVLKLTYNEFEWMIIEEIVADVQLIKQNGEAKTLVRNAMFTKKWESVSKYEMHDEGYDFENIKSARVNVLFYNISNQQETGSGYSGYSDYQEEEISRLRYSASNVVMCIEKNIGKEHQCSCGQIYSNKLQKCPLCGKVRKE